MKGASASKIVLMIQVIITYNASVFVTDFNGITQFVEMYIDRAST